MSDEQQSKGWLKTFPGIISSIAAVLTAITGLVVALNQMGILGGSNQVSQSTVRDTAQTASEQSSDSSRPQINNKTETGTPAVLHKQRYKNTGSKLYRYDFDAPQKLSKKTSNVDFFFKANDPRDPNTKIGIVPYNGAKFAPRAIDLFPWEVPESDFTTAQGIYSIPQGEKVPCITSERAYCVFYLDMNENEFVVSFILYELR